ncbi:hypothetical protein SAMN05421771_3028 [Granulicella pectinivorans]|uniref:Uncharacterized protein n=1 Tax=Granulicella pectinivorans TaxID=474950 RepID=A0A1I6MMS2_9BACT|nr:hypothetical protein [Granulicella pectinivorans]SFS17016.1 hypothetical protein SAMN05421771_3028 [Granulicella pectinivorans]
MKLTGKLTDPINAKQLAKLQERWKRMSRRGLALHTLFIGSALFIWMCVCYFSLMYFSGHFHLVREPLILYTTLISFLFPAGIFPIAQYWATKRMVSRLMPTEA